MMSNFLPDKPQPIQPTLTPIGELQDPQVLRQRLKALLSEPNLLPEKFLAFMVDYLAVNQADIPISNIRGFQTFTAQQKSVSTQESTASITPTDLATVGPTVSIGKGIYLVMWGAAIRNTFGGGTAGEMSINLNGAASGYGIATNGSVGFSSVMMTALPTLGGSANTLQAKYRSTDGAASADFYNRWLVTVRTGNA